MKIDEIQKEFEQMRQRRTQADAAFKANDFALAADLYVKAIKLLEKAYHDDHPDVYGALQNLADSYSSIRRYKESIPVFSRLLVVQEKGLAPDNGDHAVTLFKMAKSFDRMDQIDEAQACYERTIVAVLRDLPKGHTLNSIARESYASMLRRVHMNERAAELDEEAKLIRREIQGQRNLANTILATFSEEAMASENAPRTSAPSEPRIDQVVTRQHLQALEGAPRATPGPAPAAEQSKSVHAEEEVEASEVQRILSSPITPRSAFILGCVVATIVFLLIIFEHRIESFLTNIIMPAPPVPATTPANANTEPAKSDAAIVMPPPVQPSTTAASAAPVPAVKKTRKASMPRKSVRPIQTGADPWSNLQRSRERLLSR